MAKHTNGETLTVACKRVDLHTPHFNELIESADRYKVAGVRAVQVTTRREVKTLLYANTNTANPGDWIVTNPGFSTYKKLEIANCKKITSPPTFPSDLEQLKISNCRNLESLPALPEDLKKLES